MSESNGRNGGQGDHGKDRTDQQDHEPFAAKAERFRRLLADLIAKRIMNKRRGQSGGGKG
jgi:hypothetical protein